MKYKSDRPITEKEAIIMTKQLGMMHILYYMRGHVEKMMHDFEHIREMLGDIPPEKVILNWLNTENNLINYLSAWEESYYKDILFKGKREIFDNRDIRNRTITL